MKFVKKDGGFRRRAPRKPRYLHGPVGRPGKGTQLQYQSGGPQLGGHLAGARPRSVTTIAVGAVGLSLAGVALLVGACTRAVPVQIRLAPASASTTDPTARIGTAVLGAWRAAEDGFFAAESQTAGYTSPQLDAGFAEPELGAIKRNLALQSFEGEVGEGPWDLGDPVVVSIGPTEADPTVATVQSCLHDTQVLVYRATGKPVPGVLGSQDWAGATSQMVLTAPGTWKVSTQEFLIENDRRTACAGLGS